MKVLHKHFVGILKVTIAIFGITTLSSSSSYDTRVMGFLNETCDSLDLMLFQNMVDLVDFNGTEMNGVTWNFESYINVSDYEFTDNPTCNLMSEFLKPPEVRTTRPKPKIIPTPPPPPQVPAKPQEPKPEKKKDPVALSGTEARELKNCLQNRLEALGDDLVKKPSEVVKEDLGCFVKMGLDDLTFKKTNFTWGIKLSDEGLLGATYYGSKTVALFPKTIQKRVNKIRRSGRNITIEHLAAHASLDELVHTLQEEPKPYEMYDLQVQANVFSFVWYKQLHNDKTPPIRIYETSIINKHRDSDCNLKEGTEFMTKKNRYIELEAKKAKGTLEIDPEHDIDESEEMGILENWFRGDLPEWKFHGLFDSGADLGCTEKEKKD